MRDGLPVVRNEATCASARGQEGNYDRGGRSHQMSMSSSTCLPSEVTNTVEIFSIRTTNPTIGLTYRVYSSGIKIHKASTIHINLDVAVHHGCPLATVCAVHDHSCDVLCIQRRGNSRVCCMLHSEEIKGQGPEWCGWRRSWFLNPWTGLTTFWGLVIDSCQWRGISGPAVWRTGD